MPEFLPLVGPSLDGTAVETVGLALGLLGPGGPEKSSLTHIPSVGKESWSTWESETPGVILVGKDRDRGRISRDMTWWCIVAGSETEVGGCSSRIRRPYKIEGFTLGFRTLPPCLRIVNLRRQSPEPPTLASQPPSSSYPHRSHH